MDAVYSYASVEAVLAKVFTADAAAQKGVLRGRIKHLQRLKLTRKAPGADRRIAYTKDLIFELGFCLHLEQLGIDPTLAVRLLQARRDYILHAFVKAEHALAKGDNYFFWLIAEFMSARWSKEKLRFPGLPGIGSGPMPGLQDQLARFDHTQHRCLALFHMTPLVREVLQAAETEA